MLQNLEHNGKMKNTLIVNNIFREWKRPWKQNMFFRFYDPSKLSQ